MRQGDDSCPCLSSVRVAVAPAASHLAWHRALSCTEADGTSRPAWPSALRPRTHDAQELGEDIGWQYKRPSNLAKQGMRFKLLRALPWRRVKKGSVLTMDLGGSIPEAKQGGFGGGLSVADLTEAFQKAALDPRIIGAPGLLHGVGSRDAHAASASLRERWVRIKGVRGPHLGALGLLLREDFPRQPGRCSWSQLFDTLAAQLQPTQSRTRPLEAWHAPALPANRRSMPTVQRRSLCQGSTACTAGCAAVTSSPPPQRLHCSAGVYINISPLDVGWAKLTEIVRYVRAFRQSGKFCWSYLELGGEKVHPLPTAAVLGGDGGPSAVSLVQQPQLTMCRAGGSQHRRGSLLLQACTAQQVVLQG